MKVQIFNLQLEINSEMIEKTNVQTPALKIAILLARFPCISETFILNQINYLVEAGHQVDIYSYDRDELPVQPQVMKNGLLQKTQYVKMVYDKLGRYKSALPLFLNSTRKASLLKTINPFKFGKAALSLRLFYQTEMYSDDTYDLVHAHFGKMGLEAIRLKELGLFPNTPLITSFHGYDINPKYIEEYKETYKKLFAASAFITANSTFTLDLIKEAGCPQSKIAKVPESLDTTYFKRDPTIVKTPGKIRIVFIGRLIEFKAPELVVEIANIIIHERGNKDVEFHMIGDGPLKEQVVNAIKRYKLEDDVILHGAMIQDNILKIMPQMDIFLYPGINDVVTGRSENQGLVIQEAQALELPVVTSNAGGIAEGVIDGKTAFVLEQRDLTGFADKLTLLIQDPELRKTMGIAGRAFVVDKFDIHPLGERLMDVYDAAKEELAFSA
jgi:colanic acid/amylovoran biosynthesis glycosyltransferase